MGNITFLDTDSGTIDDIDIILWFFDDVHGGLPAYSAVEDISKLEKNHRLSAKIYSFLAMVSVEYVPFDWSIISVPENKKALCYGYNVNNNWLVLTLSVPSKYSRWLLTYSPDIIPKCNSFFTELGKLDGNWNNDMEELLLNILSDFKVYCKGIDNLGVLDFEGLKL